MAKDSQITSAGEYTVKQVARMLGLTNRAIQRYCTDRVFPNAYRRGPGAAAWRIPVEDVESFRGKYRKGEDEPAA